MINNSNLSKEKNLSYFSLAEEKLNIFDSFIFIWESFNKKRKTQLLVHLIMIIIGAISEVILIMTFIPFLSIINNSDVNSDKAYIINNLINSIKFGNYLNPTIKITIVFCVVVLISTFLRIINTWLSARLSGAIGADLSTRCFKLNLIQTYEKFLTLNSSELLSSLSIFINKTIVALNALLGMVSAIFLSGSIISALLIINPLSTIIAFGFIGSFYLMISKSSVFTLNKNSREFTNLSKTQIKNVQESLANVRDIILDNSYSFYLNKYRFDESIRRKTQAENLFITNFPRFAIEGLGFITLGVFSCIGIIYLDESSKVIEILGVLVFGMQRLLPCFQKVYSSFAIINRNSSEIKKVINILKLENLEIVRKKDLKPFFFNNKIQLKNINFGYGTPPKFVLKGINLTIKKGENIGIIGETGSGKSTFLDIFMSLLAPLSGEFVVDNKNIIKDDNAISSWRSLISHVPQTVFLADASIEENIVFGIPLSEINQERLLKCVEAAQLKDLIARSRNGLKTIVGERGVFLSGGEKQRIGIARALYKKSEIIIFDEATSSLDSNTEQLIIDSIYNFRSDLTIISVAHRLKTLKKCDRILKVENNKLIEVDPSVINPKD